MTCVGVWTTRDEYGVYQDCHVWSPFYTIIGVLVVISGGVNTLFGIQRLYDPGRRIVPFFLTLHSMLLMLVYISRLSTGLVLGDKNVALNFFHGLSLGCLWGGVNSMIFSYLEVVLLTEKLRGRTEIIHQRARGGFLIVTILFILVTIICFTVPCFAPGMSLPNSYWSFLAVAATIDSAQLFWYYGWGVRKILSSMEVNKTFYAALIKKLDVLLFPMLVAPPSTIGSCIIFLTVPIFFQNMYILVGMMMVMSQGVTTMFLIGSKSSSASSSGTPARNEGSKSGVSVTKGSSEKDPNPVHLNVQQWQQGFRETSSNSNSKELGRNSSIPSSPDHSQHQSQLEIQLIPSNRSIIELETTKQILKNSSAKGSARIEEMETTDDPEPSLGGSVRVYFPNKTESNLDLSASRSHEPLLVSSPGKDVSPNV
jgi:hypothetical protein